MVRANAGQSEWTRARADCISVRRVARQNGLGDEAARERERANPRQGEGVGENVDEARPEIKGCGKHRCAGADADGVGNEHQRCEYDEIFGRAFACAAFMRRAQGDCGFGVSGYPTVSVRPQTVIRSRTYGTQIMAVRMVTQTRYITPASS